MTEEAITKRLRYAKEKAIDILRRTDYKIVPSDNSAFCILGIRQREIRMIRVVIDKITQEDIRAVQGFQPPGNCTKEIWCQKYKEPNFEIKEIL